MLDTQLSPITSVQVSKIKVLLVYIVYPFAIASYFRKALEHRDDVDLKVAGPYTGYWIPWLGGMNVEPKYAIPPNYPLPFPHDIREFNYEILKPMMGDWIPDIIINVDAGLHFKSRPQDGYVVTVGTDPHVFNELGWYDSPRKYSDKFFNMQLSYHREGDIYLPYAYSSYDHYPVEYVLNAEYPSQNNLVNVEKDTDAVLIGMPYPQRVQWINSLKRCGVSVIFENGPIFDEARTLYNRGRIGLNWSSMDDLNARAFEIPAMKLLPVMNRVSDLPNFDIYQHTLTFSNLDEAVE